MENFLTILLCCYYVVLMLGVLTVLVAGDTGYEGSEQMFDTMTKPYRTNHRGEYAGPRAGDVTIRPATAADIARIEAAHAWHRPLDIEAARRAAEAAERVAAERSATVAKWAAEARQRIAGEVAR